MRGSWSMLLVLGSIGLAGACSDDAKPLVHDAGVHSSSDAGPAKIPRVDASMAGATAVPQCDRFDPTTCASGQVCDEVIEVVPSSGNTQIYAGCVTVDRLRSAGDPCMPWKDRYAPVPEEVYYDPCGDGLVCADDPKVRGATSCQPVCQTGNFGDTPVGCQSDSAFCLSVGAYREVCQESDKCNVMTQTGCPKGEGCYLRVNDPGTGLLGVCLKLPAAGAAVADHAACMYVNDCKPGSSCIGPLHTAPIDWTANDYACRPLCSHASASGEDAGADDAGASSSDSCAGKAACVPFKESNLGLSQLPKAPYGVCEL